MVPSSTLKHSIAIAGALAIVFFAVATTYAAHADEATSTAPAANPPVTPPVNNGTETASSTLPSAPAEPPAEIATTSATSSEPSEERAATTTATTTTDTNATSTDSSADAGTSTASSSDSSSGGLLSDIASFPQAFWDFVKEHLGLGTSSPDASTTDATTTPSPSFLARLFASWQLDQQTEAATSTATTSAIAEIPHDENKHEPTHTVTGHEMGELVSVTAQRIIIATGPTHALTADIPSAAAKEILLSPTTEIHTSKGGSVGLSRGDLVSVKSTIDADGTETATEIVVGKKAALHTNQ